MTFSLQKSATMTDMQAISKQPQHLDSNSDISSDSSGETEFNSPENSFSQLFSLFSNDENPSAEIAGETQVGEVKAIDKEGIVSTDTDVESEIVKPVFADDLTVPMTANESETKNESSDEFLTRLGQSSMLLQENPTADSTHSVQTVASGNKLPMQASIVSTSPVKLDAVENNTVIDEAIEGLSIAGTALNIPIVDSSDTISPIQSNASGSNETGDETTDGSHEEQQTPDTLMQGMTQAIPLADTNAALLSPVAAAMAGIVDSSDREAALSENDILSSGKLTASGLLDSESPTSKGTSEFSMMLADAANGKKTPFGQVNNAIAASMGGAASMAVENHSNSASEQQAAMTTDSIEQLDFAQIMESARKPEVLEQTTRTMGKAPTLTDLEQQVLEKRVNLNNNLASSELNEKIAIMAGKELQSATIRLDPAELGSMNIKLVMQNDQLNVTIQAQNHQSRDLLEQQMPRLREMLQQQGMTLGDTQVQADSGQQQSGFQQSRQENGQKNSNNEANYAIDSQTEVPVSTQYWQDSAKGVDFYA